MLLQKWILQHYLRSMPGRQVSKRMDRGVLQWR